jgi:Ca2+-binding EF-hand superfamily protein
MDAGHQRMKGAKAMPGKGMGDMKHEMSSAEKIKTMDTDGDGMLSTSEHDAGAQKMFTDMDANHDGSLSRAEMEAGHAAMESGMQHDAMDKDSDDAYDADKDDTGDK